MNKRKPCDYDERRKAETQEKLMRGLQKMKSSKEFRNKPLSFYHLSKITGVSVNTIKKYPNIVSTIEKSRVPNIKLESAHVNVGKIRTLEEAQAVAEIMEKMYNDIVSKHNKVLDTNVRLEMENAKLMDERNELRHQLKILMSQGND